MSSVRSPIDGKAPIEAESAVRASDIPIEFTNDGLSSSKTAIIGLYKLQTMVVLCLFREAAPVSLNIASDELFGRNVPSSGPDASGVHLIRPLADGTSNVRLGYRLCENVLIW